MDKTYRGTLFNVPVYTSTDAEVMSDQVKNRLEKEVQTAGQAIALGKEAGVYDEKSNNFIFNLADYFDKLGAKTRYYDKSKLINNIKSS